MSELAKLGSASCAPEILVSGRHQGGKLAARRRPFPLAEAVLGLSKAVWRVGDRLPLYQLDVRLHLLARSLVE